MRISNDTVRTIGSAVTIVTAIVALSWFAWNLSNRVGRLEDQVQRLNVAPALAQAGTPAVSNPIAQSCADLVKLAVERSTEQPTAQRLLGQLGCLKSGANSN